MGQKSRTDTFLHNLWEDWAKGLITKQRIINIYEHAKDEGGVYFCGTCLNPLRRGGECLGHSGKYNQCFPVEILRDRFPIIFSDKKYYEKK